MMETYKIVVEVGMVIWMLVIVYQDKTLSEVKLMDLVITLFFTYNLCRDCG